MHAFLLKRKRFLLLAPLILFFWLAGWQIAHEAPLRVLVASASNLPQTELIKRIPCSRAPLPDGVDRAALQAALPALADPGHRAVAYCLLGDVPSAFAEYHKAAEGGDDFAALQVYFLLARGGDTLGSGQVLEGVSFPAQELQEFFSSLLTLKSDIDLLPVARRMAELYPADPRSWQDWRSAVLAHEQASDWTGALQAYLEAIRLQRTLGVHLGRSSFDLWAGWLYQTRIVPPDLKNALIHYNAAIATQDFLDSDNPSYVYLYRGDVYQGLRPTYTPAQALQEFLHALELDPKNYWAMHAAAAVYLYDLKDYPRSVSYIDRAIALYPELPYTYLLRGDLYRQQGDLIGALKAYKDALVHQPGYQTAIDRTAAVQAEIKKKAP